MAEAYCFIVLKGDLISVIGIGIVVLITGYLMIDSILSMFMNQREEMKKQIEQLYIEESKKWNECYEELLNLQKENYTAVKKNTEMLEKQLEELMLRLDTLENNNCNAMNKISELQLMDMEGQKKALNLEIKYQRENTEQLKKAFIKVANQIASSKVVAMDHKHKIDGKKEVGKDANKVAPSVVPLYNDPNKELTKDEIAALFESYGQ
jgi:hypothetical protein